MRKYYLAYGSNLNIDQMLQRCPGAIRVGTAELEGYRITFRGRFQDAFRGGVANIEPRGGSRVPVGIWSVTESDERALDRYEGFPHLYKKVEFRVKLPDLRTVSATAYVMVKGLAWSQPSPYYLNIIKQGYRDFRFSNRRLMYAARTRLEEVSPDT